jgi:glycosyltransferase involved in cell wall biosynthesis
MTNFSIIIPMYNVAEYLERCINSVYDQGICESKFETILVNDGSTDNSVEVATFLTKDRTNVQIISQKNRGLGGARNTGIDNATGSYIIFLDADDYLLPNKLELLYKQAIKNNLDILEFGSEGVTPQGSVIYRKSKKGHGKPLTGQEYLASVNYMVSACNKLYATSLLKDNKLRFLERVFIEDVEFNTRVFLYAKLVMATPDVCAHFVSTEGSITRAVSPEKQYKMMDDMLEVITIINDFVQKNYPEYSVAKPRLQKRISNLTISLLSRSMHYSGDIKRQKNIIVQLQSRGLYPVVNRTDSSKKDIYKLFANSKFTYLMLCRFKNFVGNYYR